MCELYCFSQCNFELFRLRINYDFTVAVVYLCCCLLLLSLQMRATVRFSARSPLIGVVISQSVSCSPNSVKNVGMMGR